MWAKLVVGFVVAAVAAAGGSFVVSKLFSRSAELPETIAGIPQLNSPLTDEILSQAKAEFDSTGIDGDIAIYGTGTPHLMVGWVHDPSVGDPQAAFGAMAGGAATEGAVIEGSQGEVVEGVEYVCAPISSGPMVAGVCLWEDEGLWWVVVDFESGDDLAVVREMAHQTNLAAGS